MTSYLHCIVCMLALLTAKSIEEEYAGSDKIILMDEYTNVAPQPIRQQSNLFHHGQNDRPQAYVQQLTGKRSDYTEQSDESGRSQEQCGGILTAAHGVIQTPNFPNKFRVPITCVWIIDASELVTGPNTSIVVYLTQLYVLNGIKFTEYMYYSDDYKVPSHRVFELTEDDVTQVAWIQFTSQYLEIRFTMRALDGTHLRALDRLLDVYGFNITYEVDAVKSYQCNALQCRFLGHCYARQDFTSYYCSCFPGFSGRDCGKGPLCEDPDMNFCENGGTCKHIGDAAVTCLCPPGYKGNKCEIFETTMLSGCSFESAPDCYQSCILAEAGSTGSNVCGCNNSKKEAAGNPSSTRAGKTRYEVTIRLGSNLTGLYKAYENSEKRLNEHLPGLLEKHISRVLRMFNVTKVTDLEIINNTSSRLDITFHFFGMKGDSTRIREAITRMVERGRLGNITLVSNFHLFDENPPFKLQTVELSKTAPIREGMEFSISCTAQGSSKVEFRWYKDEMAVNASKATRDIWTIIVPPEQKGVYTSRLIVDKADRLDEGVYTCKVSDWGMEQCQSVVVQVQTPPQIRVDPVSVTLFRGDSLLVRCLSPGNDQQRYGQLGYSWTRNGVLFQSDPNTVMWEDLYPDGSILKIRNIQKSAEFTCLVSNIISPVSRSMYVTVIDKGVIDLCPAGPNFGVQWPLSAPGVAISTDCPKRYQGFARRMCEQQDISKSTWLTPDFSNCIADEMVIIYNQFRALSLGYQKANCSSILKACLEFAMKQQRSFLPGEADFLMDLLQQIEKYLKIRGTHLEKEMAAEIILHILDKVMQNKFSMNNQQQIKKLQLLTQSAALNRETIAASQLATSTSTSSGSAVLTAVSSSSSLSGSNSGSSSASSSSSGTLAASFSSTSTIADSLDRLNSFRIYTTTVKTLPFNLRIYGDELFTDQLYMDIAITKNLLDAMSNGTIFASVISYRNLTRFLPKTYYSRGSDGPDIDYMPASRIIATWLFQSNRANDNFVEPLNLPLDTGHVEIIFHHESKPKNAEWIPTCGHELRATFESTWETDLCITKSLMENITRCICPLSGTFVVLFAKKNYNTSIARTQNRPIFVIISCGCCFLQSCTAFAFLIPVLYNRKCCITFLKMQFCTSTSTVMAIYLLGFLRLLPQDWHGIVSSTLASLMLLGLSTLVAITLVVQSELVPKKIQMTNLSSGIRGAIGISWLIPILFAICSPLIYTIIGKWPLYWWLETGSSGFILFIVVACLFMGLFALLFVTLIKKLLYLMKRHDKHNVSIWRRIGLLYRTGVILLLKLSSDSLFLIYLNTTEDLITSHLFGVCCILLGFSILFCFVIKAEYNLRSDTLKKMEAKTSLEDNYCSSSINSPLSFYANHEIEKDNESGPPSVGTTRFPLTIIQGPHSSVDARMSGKSVETFLGVVGSTNSNSGTILVSDKNGMCDTSFHEMEVVSSKGGEQIRSYPSKSRCCNILSSASKKHDETWENENDESHEFYDSYQASHINCSRQETHEFVGVGTLDILQGVSQDSIIGIRTSSILSGSGGKAPVKPVVEANTGTNSVTTQTPKSQKRVTIEEPKKIIQNEPPASGHPARLPSTPPIITITSSGDDEGVKPIASITHLLPSNEPAPSVARGNNSNLETVDDDAIDGMLDRISHDLDYLLNRTSEIPQRRVGGGSGTDSNCTTINDSSSLAAHPTSSSTVILTGTSNVKECSIPPPPLPPNITILPPSPAANLLPSHCRSVHEVIIEESEQE